MKTFPISSPPHHAGIYALTNRKTGHIYVGQAVNLHRRYGEWKGVFASGIGAKSKPILALARDTGPDDWDFTILFDMPGASVKELDVVERRAIAHVSNSRPKDVLNKIFSSAPAEPHGNKGDVRKSRVIGPDGAEMTYTEVAAALQVKPQAVKKRLHKYRAKGVFDVSLDLLKTRSENIGRPKKQVVT